MAKFIQKALSKPGSKGALHEELDVPPGKKIPKSKIKQAAKSSNPLLAKRARFAELLGSFTKRKSQGK